MAVVCAVMLTWPYSDVQQVLLAVNYSTSTLLLQVFASVSQTGFLGTVVSGQSPIRASPNGYAYTAHHKRQ